MKVPHHHVLRIVTTASNGDEIVIASASYIAESGPAAGRTAEVAFTVEEDYQGQGIASRLLAHLSSIAREQGIARFEAFVLPSQMETAR